MKRILFAIISLFGLTACQVTVPQKSTPEKHADIWFFHHAKAGTIEQTGNGEYSLTMKGDNVYFLSDRPVRESGPFARQKFVSMWKANGTFEKDKPNAAFFGQLSLKNPKSDQKFEPFTCIVTDATYNANTDSITYTIKPLDKSQVVREGDYNNVVFFLDGENNFGTGGGF
jgi:hypothetical protein